MPRLCLALALLALPRAALGVEPPAPGSQGLDCERLSFQVALAPNAPADQTMVGWLCARGQVAHRTLQVLLHGGTYDHHYWDFPYRPGEYSYVQALTAAGFATLAFDRLGSGESSHPDGFALTLTAQAHALHQVVQALRSGTVQTERFGTLSAGKVQLVGHSLGAFICAIEASTYGDVDGVILSGLAHSFGPGIFLLPSLNYPAELDPKFAGAGLPPGYLTTLPGTRDEAYYHTPAAEPQVIALDEQLKQTLTIGELGDFGTGLAATFGIQVPTLVVVGDYDSLFCAPPSCSATGSLAAEATFYSPHACMQLVNVPNSGHVLNLHTPAPLWFREAAQWSSRWVGRSASAPPPVPCP